MFHGLLMLLSGQALDDLTGNAGGGDNQTLVILLQQGTINARAGKKTLAHAIEVCAAGQPDQVAVADLVFGQQQQVIVVLAATGHRIAARTGSHIRFHADDRLDPGLLGSVVELHCPVHDTVISQSNTVHTEFRSPRRDSLSRRVAVEQAILGMNV